MSISRGSGRSAGAKGAPGTGRRGADLAGLEKVPSGVRGLDEITLGGLPKGRPILVSGGPGCGKTLLAMEFVARGIVDYGEPGVFVAFEERVEDLEKNFASLGFDLPDLVEQGKLVLDHIHIDRAELHEAGAYDLEGLFIRLGAHIDRVGAKRIAIDTIEAVFSSFSNEAILRSELRRLFLWLKDRGVTAIITGERGDRTITKYGLEEYVADCVITLDHQVSHQIATRRLRVVKYRGSVHGTDEHPFLIDDDGISVLPITSMSLRHMASRERIPTGIPRLDTMLGGSGFYRGASVLVSGQSGTGKTSVAATFADATCRRGERCLYVLFEESESQLLRNMESIGLDLAPWVERDLLRFHAVRPTAQSLEMHLSTMLKLIEEFAPQVLVVDPISNLFPIGDDPQVRSMLMRLIDQAKSLGITGLFTNLSEDVQPGAFALESTRAHVSSLIDTWLLLQNVVGEGEHNRAFWIAKSRGMAHSNQIREFVLTDHGIELLDVARGGKVLFGSARLEQESRHRAAQIRSDEEIAQRERDLEQKRRLMESEVAALQERFAREAEEVAVFIEQQRARKEAIGSAAEAHAAHRWVDGS